MKVIHAKPTSKSTIKQSGRGFLDEYSSPVGDVPVLHVAGTSEEMGHQYGVLVGDKIKRNVQRMIGLFTEAGVPEPLVNLLLDNAWKRLEPHTPDRYLREMAAIATGAETAGYALTLDDVRHITAVA